MTERPVNSGIRDEVVVGEGISDYAGGGRDTTPTNQLIEVGSGRLLGVLVHRLTDDLSFLDTP